jgi:hypothetical protein
VTAAGRRAWTLPHCSAVSGCSNTSRRFATTPSIPRYCRAIATIGLNHLSSDRGLWFTLADCVASKLLTGKAPKVERAIRFRPQLFCSFTPAVSSSALKAMRARIRDLNIRQRTPLSLADIARKLNPLLSGWIEYYGRYAPSALSPMLRYVNLTLLRWAMRKFKRFKAHKIRASHFLQRLARDQMSLFVHWRIGMTGTFA